VDKATLEQDVLKHLTESEYKLIKKILTKLRPSQLLAFQAKAKADQGRDDKIEGGMLK